MRAEDVVTIRLPGPLGMGCESGVLVELVDLDSVAALLLPLTLRTLGVLSFEASLKACYFLTEILLIADHLWAQRGGPRAQAGVTLPTTSYVPYAEQLFQSLHERKLTVGLAPHNNVIYERLPSFASLLQRVKEASPRNLWMVGVIGNLGPAYSEAASLSLFISSSKMFEIISFSSKSTGSGMKEMEAPIMTTSSPLRLSCLALYDEDGKHYGKGLRSMGDSSPLFLMAELVSGEPFEEKLLPGLLLGVLEDPSLAPKLPSFSISEKEKGNYKRKMKIGADLQAKRLPRRRNTHSYSRCDLNLEYVKDMRRKNDKLLRKARRMYKKGWNKKELQTAIARQN
ncbi:hypothetical protein FNV43_RR21868 [Rhamnella rubrinervis]|uniref:Uncharacterized protein n=1 Tax=Rhamnella rubrinervis TaxID=2594499 RepID=A0A8K0E0U7_9ROSA|nr:hypothetical protein FNV43_RR21868 [Rhamnella rubrinervis]